MILEKRFKFLCEVKKILDKAGVEFWIDFGTLLGFYRQGDFLETDPDIDIGVKREYQDKVVAVTGELSKLGKLVTRVDMAHQPYLAGYKIHRDDLWLDIAFFWPWGKEYIFPISEWPQVMTFKKEFYDNLVDIEVKGVKFKMPEKIEEYMVLHYGEDWRVPFTKGQEYDLHSRPNVKPIDNYLSALR